MSFELESTSTRNVSASTEPASNIPAKGSRILVVDDDPLVSTMVSTVLRRSGYQVETAADGAEAWEVISAHPFDLLVTDFSMPKMDGLDLLRQLRSKSLPLPAIMMSAAMPEDDPDLYELISVNAALHKPFGIKELLSKVEEVLSTGPEFVVPSDKRDESRTAESTGNPGEAARPRKKIPAGSRAAFGIWGRDPILGSPLTH